jgi:hypothetical protein
MKRTPLKRKTELRRKSPMPRSTIKRSSAARKTPMEKAHLDRIAKMPCCICQKPGPSTVHHVTAPITGGRISRSHKRVVPLCAPHHQHDHGLESVERLSHAGIYARFGVDLLREAERLWEESCAAQLA